MGFLCNTERIVTRALAIGFIAVGAGAAHSWLSGPLRPARPAQTKQPAPNQQPQTQGGEQPAPPPERPQGDDPTADPNDDPNASPNADPGDQSGGESTLDQPAGDKPGSQEPTPPPPQDLPEDHISLADAYAHWENGTAVFVDTRSASSFAEGHIPMALNLSLEMTGDPTAVNNVLNFIQRSDTIILYCRGGLCDESKNVGELLNSAGFNNTFILGEGYPGWVEAGYMTETGGG